MTDDELRWELNCYKRAVRDAELAKLEFKRVHADVMALKSPTITDMPKGHESKDLSDAMARLYEVETKLVNRINRSTGAYHVVDTLLSHLGEGSEQDVMRYRYLCLLRWSDVAKRMHYDQSSVYRLYNSAARKLRKLPKHESKCEF